MLLKKGVDPYEYFDSWDRFDIFPSIEKYYNNMRMESINVNDHNHALKVWDLFEIKTLGDYHDVYVQAHTAQLSDVFENLISLFLEKHQLDPAYFVSLPS